MLSSCHRWVGHFEISLQVKGSGVVGTVRECGRDTFKHAHGLAMNIADAKEAFSERKVAAISEIDALVKIWRKYGVDDPFPNSTLTHALTLTGVMFRHTDCELRMVTGGFGDGFIECLSDEFDKMLCRLRRNGGRARVVVVDGGEEQEVLRRFTDEFKDTLLWTPATARGAKLSHYIICDDDMVRDEEPHGPLSSDTPENEVRADVYFNNRSVASLFAKRFDILWNKLRAMASPAK